MTKIEEDEEFDSIVKTRLIQTKIEETDFNAKFFKSDEEIEAEQEREEEEE